ncbi:pentatricopeptide repeat-containing protein [Cinnamomum micranthum f. kanehirae]|uniref:Pentatricopeptide repeat-containing protein n=1 Tax=Cinnamomum micranthum f. kanehirae TaxID=337451 RepID=A0A3S3R8L9_9MAGN|nr:pentatricopeptide repeat-containing protein [Cinnamomum micranthum f. kanehirae]
MGFALPAIPHSLISKPNSFLNDSGELSTHTFSDMLESCTQKKSIPEANRIHCLLVVSGFIRSPLVASKLVRAYSLCGSFEMAHQVFDEIPQRDVVVWNSMIRGYISNGLHLEALQLFSQMLLEGVEPDSFVFPGILKACSALMAFIFGLNVHGYMIKCGIDINVFVGTALVDMYSKLGYVELSRRVFDALPERGIASYNALVAGYTQNGNLEDALALFRSLQFENIQANSVTLLHFLSAATAFSELRLGKEIHGFMIRNELDMEVANLNSLINMYSKCGCVELGRRIFDRMAQRNVISWNTMIGGLNQNGYDSEALNLFAQMQIKGAKIDNVTVTSTLAACANLEDLKRGKEIHTYTIRSCFFHDPLVGVALIDLYGKCNCVKEARYIFDTVSVRDIPAWGVIITAYVQNSHAIVALELLRELQKENLKPNSVILASVLDSCAQIASLAHGKEIHGFLLRRGMDSDVFVGTALLNMYCKCGDIKSARFLFESLQSKNIVTWTSMMGGYGMHGYGHEVLSLFERLKMAGMKPDHVTFVSVLSACSHMGLVEEGWRYLNDMYSVYGVVPRQEHYACMVDLMGRAGLLIEAYNFIKEMPFKPDCKIWGALLGACRIHANLELGKVVAAHIFELEPHNLGNYLLLSSIYDSMGKQADKAGIEPMIIEKGLKKNPGCSWVELNRGVHAFLAGDRSHPESKAIYGALENITIEMIIAGYVPSIYSDNEIEASVNK